MPGYLDRRHHRARVVRDLLRTEILDGRWVGQVLPTEDEVSARFHAGRNVVREALALLVDERLVKRVPGSGTRPTAHVIVHSLNSLRGIAEDGTSNVDGGSVEYHLLAWETVPAPATIAEQLGVSEGESVIFWERLTVGVEPLVLWSSWIRADLGLERPADVTGSLGGGTFAYFESHGLVVEVAHARTGAAQADPGIAELLGTSAGSPTMVQHRQTRVASGDIIEVAVGYYRSDLIFLSNDFRRPPR